MNNSHCTFSETYLEYCEDLDNQLSNDEINKSSPKTLPQKKIFQLNIDISKQSKIRCSSPGTMNSPNPKSFPPPKRITKQSELLLQKSYESSGTFDIKLSSSSSRKSSYSYLDKSSD